MMRGSRSDGRSRCHLPTELRKTGPRSRASTRVERVRALRARRRPAEARRRVPGGCQPLALEQSDRTAHPGRHTGDGWSSRGLRRGPRSAPRDTRGGRGKACPPRCLAPTTSRGLQGGEDGVPRPSVRSPSGGRDARRRSRRHHVHPGRCARGARRGNARGPTRSAGRSWASSLPSGASDAARNSGRKRRRSSRPGSRFHGRATATPRRRSRECRQWLELEVGGQTGSSRARSRCQGAGRGCDG